MWVGGVSYLDRGKNKMVMYQIWWIFELVSPSPTWIWWLRWAELRREDDHHGRGARLRARIFGGGLDRRAKTGGYHPNYGGEHVWTVQYCVLRVEREWLPWLRKVERWKRSCRVDLTWAWWSLSKNSKIEMMEGSTYVSILLFPFKGNPLGSSWAP